MLSLLPLLVAAPQDVLMYHVGPRHYGPNPADSDTADAAGDFFFEMFEVISIPLACGDTDVCPGWNCPFECRNPEASDPDDVINKIVLSVDGFSGYAMCNIGANGTDPFGLPCESGTYCCRCPDESGHHHYPPKWAPCNATVGRQDIHSHFGNQSHGWHKCKKDYDCWTDHAAQKLTDAEPGMWYSPLSYGACETHPGSATNCTWSLKSVEKIVSKKCHDDSFFGQIQAAAPTCFDDECGGGAANATDPCWIRCFYRAVLGPDADKPDGKVAGLPLDQLLGFWRKPFESDEASEGGCPALPVPPPGPPPAPRPFEPLSRRQRRWREFAAKWYA